MAFDLWMLESGRPGESGAIRVYGWTRPALTFGFSQPWKSVEDHRRQLEEPVPRECVRRPTGGGVVDHRNDWTYALALFHPTPLAAARPQAVYDTVHRSLARAFVSVGLESLLTPCHRSPCQIDGAATPQAQRPALSVCFQQPVPGDLVAPSTGLKIAGAALKRTRSGVLLQGSVNAAFLSERAANELETFFIQEISALLETDITQGTLPPVHDLEESIIRFSSSGWNQRR